MNSMKTTIGVARVLLDRFVRNFFEASALTFWKIEAREWRKLYQEQRGGEAFKDIQRQLLEARAEVLRLKALIPDNKVEHVIRPDLNTSGLSRLPTSSSSTTATKEKKTMYKLQETPDPKIRMENGSVVTPVATLKDEYGGISHIIVDDHCYVLVNGSNDRPFRSVKHWYPEAVDAMRTLPTPSMP